MQEVIAEVLGQIIELVMPPWSMSQALTLLPEQSGTPRAHIPGANWLQEFILFVTSIYFSLKESIGRDQGPCCSGPTSTPVEQTPGITLLLGPSQELEKQSTLGKTPQARVTAFFRGQPAPLGHVLFFPICTILELLNGITHSISLVPLRPVNIGR